MTTRLLGAVLFLSVVATFSPAAATEQEPFPEYDAIAGNVDFWIRVFSEWTRAQVAVHDADHPEIVYEVLDLPGPIAERYSDEQVEFLDDARGAWGAFLEGVERKIAAAEELDEIERAWADYIVEGVGPEGLAGAHARVRTQRGVRARFREGLGRAARYEHSIREIFRGAGLPEDLAYLPHVESSFQYHARSSVGATGLWQFTRSTGRAYLRIDSLVDERLDPIAATHGAARYLRDAHDALGSWPIALTSFRRFIWSSVSSNSRQPRLDSSWGAVRAPTPHGAGELGAQGCSRPCRMASSSS